MKKIGWVSVLVLLAFTTTWWFSRSPVARPPTVASNASSAVPHPPSSAAVRSAQTAPVNAAAATNPPPPPLTAEHPHPVAKLGFTIKKEILHFEHEEASGTEIKRITISDTDFQYPLIRTLVSSQRDRMTGREQVVSQVSMVADHVMVKVKPGKTDQEIAAAANKLGLNVRGRVGEKSIYLLQFDLKGSDRLPEVVEQLKQTPEWVAVVEPDFIVTTQDITPNDPAYKDGTLWNLNNTGQRGVADQDIDAPEGWATQHDAPEVIVAVVDTGIRLTHEDLKDNLWTNPGESGSGRENNGIDDDHNGYIDDVHGVNVINKTGDPTDDVGHGTHVAGIIAASGNNGVGSVGVAWKAKIMSVKFLNAEGGGSLSGAIEAMDYARKMGAQVINASWGANGYSTLLEESFKEAGDAGAAIACAAGNFGQDIGSVPFTPASFDFPFQLTVAALAASGDLAGYSNYGGAHIAAPGDEIYSTYFESDNSYRTLSGTSMASPHVAGALALLRARYPSDTAAQLAQRLISGAKDTNRLVHPLRYNRILKLPRALAEANLPLLPLIKTATYRVDGNFGDTITLTNEVISSTAASGQWYFNGAPIPGATQTTLTLPSVQRTAAGGYTFTATNTAGTAASRRIFVRLIGPPTVADEPTSLTVVKGNEAHFSATILGNELEPIQYQWYHNEVPVAGGTFATLYIKAAADEDAGSYRINATNTFGTTSSRAVTLTVSPSRAPVFTTPPKSITVTADQDVRFTVAADGTDFLLYQWYKDGVLLNNETGTTLVIKRAQETDVGDYSAQVKNSGGGSFSPSAHLAVTFAPVAPFIVRQPVSQVVGRGEMLTLSVGAKGTPSPSYQWRRNGADLPGATLPTYHIDKTYPDAVGDYEVRVTNPSGSVVSDKIQVSLTSGSDIPGWTWRFPLPQGNNLYRVVYSKGRFITVGGHGIVFTSDDAVVWTSRSTGTTRDLSGLVEGGGKLVATGVAGTILVSEDGGVSWNPAESGTTETLAAFYLNGRFYALSYANPQILTSPDGLHWERLPIGPITYPQGMYSVNGQIYLSCFPGRLYRSSDATAWELVSEDPTGDYITYGAGVFLKITISEIWSSVDGKNWVLRRSGSTFSPSFIGREFIAFDTNGHIVHSPDGVTWTDSPAFPALEFLGSMAYGGNTYVAVGSAGLIYASKDLVKWTRQSGADGRWILGLAWGPQGFVGFDTTSYLPQHSDDGVLWKPSGTVQFSAHTTRYINTTYVAVGNNSIHSSTDGLTWAASATPPAFLMQNVAYGAGKYVVVGGTLYLELGKLPTADLATSPDLKTWSATKFEQWGLLRSVIWDGTRFVAVGMRGTLLTSPDGVSWEQQTDLTADMKKDYLRGIAYDGKRYVVGSEITPTLYSSADLKTWETFTASWTDRSLARGFEDIIYEAGRFVGLSGDSSLFTSFDGITWKAVDCGVSNQADSICYGKGTFIVSGVGFLVQSGPLTPSLNSIAVTPSRQLVLVGQPARIDVDTYGIGALRYQWLKDGNEIAGANDPSLQFARIRWSDAGVYQVRVRNDSGESTGVPAYLATAEVSLSPGSEGGRGVINVNAPDGFSWQVAGLADWLRFTTANSGSGSGKVGFTALPNSGRSRSTLLTVGGQPLRISQAGQSPGDDDTESRLINLSSRGRLDGSGEPIITGFVITGSTRMALS